MKAKIATLTVTALISAPAFAQDNTAQAFEQQVFVTHTPVNAVELSQIEMKETEGAWGPVGAAVGGVSGAAGYLLNQQISGDKFSWGKLAFATGTGAVSGAVAGPAGIIWGANGRIAGGAAYGVYKNVKNRR